MSEVGGSDRLIKGVAEGKMGDCRGDCQLMGRDEKSIVCEPPEMHSLVEEAGRGQFRLFVLLP